jgi:hypothetical protein
MTEWSEKRKNLEYMRMRTMLARADARGERKKELDRFIGDIEEEIYYQEQREKGNDGYDFSRPENKVSHGSDSTRDTDVDCLHVLKVGSRSTTFRIDGKAVTLGEFRRAAKKKGVDIEKRLKLDDKPERFVSRGEVRVEQ